MAKLTGPLMSIAAHGTIGGVLTYSRRPSANVGRYQRKQRDVLTLPRIIQRGYFKDAVWTWNLLSTENKALWNALATPLLPSGWAVYLKDYIASIKQGVPPYKLPDGTLWTDTKRTFTFAGQTLTLGAAADDGTYIWIGAYDGAFKLIRVLKADPAHFDVISLIGAHGDIRAICIDATYVWLALYADPCELVRVNRNNPTDFIVCSYNDIEGGFQCMAQDDAYLYLGPDREPCDLVRIDKTDPDGYDTFPVATVTIAFLSMYTDDTYIWAGNNASPGQLVRFLVNNPATQVITAFAFGENAIGAIVDDGTYLYCALQNDDTTVIRVTKANLAEQVNYWLGEHSLNFTCADKNTNRVWFGEFSVPARFLRATLPNLEDNVEVLCATGANYTRAVMYDGSFLWLVSESTPGYLTKFWL